MRYRWWIAVALAACKTRGTIELDFDLSGAVCPSFGSASSYVLYAEPRTGCSACACGACAGTAPDAVVSCPGSDGVGPCDADQLHGRGLALDPGVWAVVLEGYDAEDPPAMVGSQCIDVTVDADGTTSETIDTAACAACAH